MGMVEVADAFAPYARYMVSSPELMFAAGNDFEPVLEQLTADPLMSPRKFCEIVADEFMITSQKILDYYGVTEGVPFGMSVVDLCWAGELTDAFAALTDSFRSDPTGWWLDVYRSAYPAQRYFDIYSYDEYTGYVDLADFADILSYLASSEEIAAKAALLRDTAKRAVVYNRKNDDMPYSNGLSVFIPGEVSSYGDDLAVYSGIGFCTKTGWGILAPALAAMVETCAGEADIYGLAISGSPLAANGSITCTASLDVFFPQDVRFVVTKKELLPDYSSYVEIVSIEKKVNTIVLPDERELEMWDLENNALSGTWDGTMLVLSNGTDTASIGVTEYDLPNSSGTYMSTMAYIYFANDDYIYVTLNFTGNTGELIECLIYGYYSYDIQSDDRIFPYIFVTGKTYATGIYSMTTEDYLVAGASSPVLMRIPAPNGEYLAGFHVTGRHYDYYFNYEEVAVQRE
jgi:hypothetical protein